MRDRGQAAAPGDITILSLRLSLAAFLDKWEARLRRVGEKLGWPQAWLQEFIEYRGDPRMTMEEFWVRFTLLRMDAEKILKPVMTETEARKFYQKHDYMLWRNLVHRRHSAWRRVLVTMLGKQGCLLEFGCGIAPITAWLLSRKPQWCFWLDDLDGPAMKYAWWRKQQGIHFAGPHDVVTAVDVFEHLADPEKIAHQLVEKKLGYGGYLHWNFVGNDRQNDLDLASPEQRDATVKYLYEHLRLIWEKDGYRVSQKL